MFHRSSPAPRRPFRLAAAAGLAGSTVLGALAGWSHEPHVTSPIGERPALDGHVSQDDIERGLLSPAQIFKAGWKLFTVQFNKLDGAGRPGATGASQPTRRVLGTAPDFIRTSGPDAMSCDGCHNQPRTGGAGEFNVNVFVLSQNRDPVDTSVGPEISDERNSLGMNGSGAIEMLAREMTTDLLAIRQAAIAEAARLGRDVTVSLETKGVAFGRITVHPLGNVDATGVEGVDQDLIVKPFGQKGVVISLREFTINAMNHHHGMQAVERFGALETGADDFDGDGVPDELSVGDITAATLWQAAQNIPGRVFPADPARRQAAEAGERRFAEIGCTSCHRPALILNDPRFSEPNLYNPLGTLRPRGVPPEGPLGLPRTFPNATSGILQLREGLYPVTFDLTQHGPGPRLERLPDGRAIVRAFTDLKRHRICEPDVPHFCNERLPQNRVPTDQFLTRKLWDVGNTAPYGHRGDLTTITEAILHHGGEARAARDRFVALPPQAQAEIVEFLNILQIVPEIMPEMLVNRPTAPQEPAAVRGGGGN